MSGTARATSVLRQAHLPKSAVPSDPSLLHHPQPMPTPAPTLRAPRCSVLKQVSFKRPPDNFVLLHLQRRHLLEWARAVLAVTLGVGPSQQLPPIILQEPGASPTKQLSERLLCRASIAAVGGRA